MEKAFLLHNRVFKDNRGTFAPIQLIFGDNRLEVLRKTWIQCNISVNTKKYTLRGLHYQEDPHAQTKLVKVISGRILDFVLDMRPESEDYGKVFFFDVSQDKEVYIPKGFAHAFLTLEDNTVVSYLIDEDYMPSKEKCIKWNSVKEVVDYFEKNNLTNVDIIISEKDLNGENYTHKK
jgi:dTDP-4-dehydrorhamnose 3,5-epimerase